MLRKIFLYYVFCACTFSAAGQTYLSTNFYVVPHFEDWQMFMGLSAWNDIRAFHERGYPFVADPGKPAAGKGVFPNGLKVVIINITAGRDYGVSASCTDECDASLPPGQRSASSFHKAGEASEMKSVSLAANRPAKSPGAKADDGWGDYWGSPGLVKDSVISINHRHIAVHLLKNVVVYELRIDESTFAAGDPMTTADNSADYPSRADLVKTIRDIYDMESARDVAPDTCVTLNVFDPDTSENPADDPAHYLAGQAALDATAGVAHCPRLNFAVKMFQGLHAAALPPNLAGDTTCAIQHKAGMLSAFTFGMLRYNALVDTGNLSPALQCGFAYTSREYYRSSKILGTTLCPDAEPVHHSRDTLPKGTPETGITLYPNPATGILLIQFSNNYPPQVNVTVRDLNAHIILHKAGIVLDQTNTTSVDVSALTNGDYAMVIDDGRQIIYNGIFTVNHLK